MTANLNTRHTTSTIVKSKCKASEYDMANEERALKAEYKEKVKVKDAEERRQARIVYLKEVIAELLPQPDEGPREEEDEIVREIEKIEKIYNFRHEARKIFKHTDEVITKSGKIGATLETINIKTDPMYLNIENETVLIMFMARGTETSMYARILGNVDVRVVNDIQLKIPRSPSEGRTAATTEEIHMPMEVDATFNMTNLPEASYDEPVLFTSGTSTKSKTTTRKREFSYKEPTTESKSEEEERKRKQHKKKKASSKSKSPKKD